MVRKYQLREVINMGIDEMEGILRRLYHATDEGDLLEHELRHLDNLYDHLHWLVDMDTTAINDEEERDI